MASTTRRRLSSFLRGLTRRRHCCNSGSILHMPGANQIVFVVVPPEGDSQAERDAAAAKTARIAEELAAKHDGHFMVHNVSEHELDPAVFQENVVVVGTPSNFRPPSLPPALEMTLALCRAVRSWTSLDEENMAVVVAPPAQMPVLAACLMVYCGFEEPPESNCHAWYIQKCRELSKISRECTELRVHSLFVAHFVAFLKAHPPASKPERGRKSSSSLTSAQSASSPRKGSAAAGPAAAASTAADDEHDDEGSGADSRESLTWLRHVVLNGVPCPQSSSSSGCRPFIMLIQGEQILFSGMSVPGGPKRYAPNTPSIRLRVGVQAKGDLILRVYDLPEGRSGNQLFAVAFNTKFVRQTKRDRGIYRIHGVDIDQVANAPSGTYPSNFSLEFHFRASNDADGDSEAPSSAASSAAASPARQGATASRSASSIALPSLQARGSARVLLQLDAAEESNETSTDDEVFFVPTRGGPPPPPPTALPPLRRSSVVTVSAPPVDEQRRQMEEDEAFARELQRQFDEEEAAAAARAREAAAVIDDAPQPPRLQHHLERMELADPLERLFRSARSPEERHRMLRHPGRHRRARGGAEPRDPETMTMGLMQLLESMQHHLNHANRSQRDLSVLPTGTVQAGSRLLGEDCLVCCGTFELEELFKTLPCLHMFHAECIDPWLMQKATCPICLTRIDVDLEVAE